jgi:ATP-dependent Lon protease
MSQVPLFIINLDEIVPLPGGTFVLDVQADQLHLFSSVEINGTEYVIIGIADCEDPTALLEEQSTLDDLLNVGVMCEILEKESEGTFTVFTLRGLHRVLIRNLERNKSEDDPYTLWVQEEPVTEEFLPNEEELQRDIEDMVGIFLRKEEIWSSAPADVLEQLRSDEHLLVKMHFMANHLLQGEDRLNYLQQLSNFDRWNLLLGAASKKLSAQARAAPLPANKVTAPAPQKKSKKILTWREKVEHSKMPDDVREKIMREVSKLESTPKNSTEYAQTVDYLRWVLSVPWGKTSYVPTDLRKLHSRLDETHYGLDDVKEHLLEIMCVQELQGGSNGSVLCFVGPAGTGKTTIAKAIAEVSNRPLIRIALGGLSDTAEFRGHRRTYVASRPGRLVSELKDKGSMDPLIILDEVDKLAHYRGDPAAVLLEILDPEQNDHFIDHYLEVPVDLSKAMFICTANYEEKIPEPLLDRMELIRFRAYDEAERNIITRQFLLPKTQAQYNNKELPVTFDEAALVEITKIPQVRQIEKILAKLVRKGVTQIHVYGRENYVVTAADVEKIKHNYQEKQRSKKIGF